MNIHLIIAYPLLIIAFLEMFLGFLLLKRNFYQSKLNTSASALSLSASLFTLFAAISYIQEYFHQDFNLAYRACWVGLLGVPAVVQCAYYLKDDNSRKAAMVGYILYPLLTGVLILNLTTNWIEAGAVSLIPFVKHYAPLEKPFRLIETVLIIWCFTELLIVRKNFTGMKRTRSNYFILGIALYTVPSSFTVGFLQIFGGFGINPTLTCYFALPWIALTFYAITRYRLFDIQLIISTSVVITLLTIILGTIDLVIFKVLAPILGPTPSIFIGLLVIIIIFLKTPLRMVIQGGLNDVFWGNKYNYQEMLKESSRAIVTMLDQDELLNYLILTIQQSFKINKACLFLKRGDASPYLMSNVWGYDENKLTDYQISSEHIIDWLMEHKKIFIKEEQQGLMFQDKFSLIYGNLGEIEAELILPLFFKYNLIGFFIFGPKNDPRPYVQSDIDILQTLASQAAIAIENSRLYTEAITDSLTKLYHHKYFLMRLEEEMERANRYGHPMSLMMIDVDNFKNINDICGHLAGDKVVVGVANFLKNKSRTVDIVARYGGDEFVVILPNTDLKGAMIKAQRLREGVEQTMFEENIQVTISMGVCSYDRVPKETTKEGLIDFADKALYLAKHNGRNRVESAH